VYSILSREPGGWHTLAIDVDSPALGGQATILLEEKGKNKISLNVKFKGNNGLWEGTVSKSQPLN